MPLFGSEPLDLTSAIVVLVFIAPVVEELVFRGFVLQTFLAKFKPVYATLVSAGIFSAVHFEFQSVGIIFRVSFDFELDFYAFKIPLVVHRVSYAE